MATVICNIKDCVHRSKRPLKKWKYSNDAPCYGCKLPTIGTDLTGLEYPSKSGGFEGYFVSKLVPKSMSLFPIHYWDGKEGL